jgi:predicted nucleic-acid-binding Zn-ribbon protein
MAYTTIKIGDKAIKIRSECPKCGVTNTVTLQKRLHETGDINVSCIACRNNYRTGVFSTKWDSANNVA